MKTSFSILLIIFFLCLNLSSNGSDNGWINGKGNHGGWRRNSWCFEFYQNIVLNTIVHADIDAGFVFGNDSSFFAPSLGLKTYLPLNKNKTFALELKGAMGMKMGLCNLYDTEYGLFVELGLLLPTFKRLPKPFIGLDCGNLFSFSDKAVVRVKFGLFFP